MIRTELARLAAGAVEDRDLEVLGGDDPVALLGVPEGGDGQAYGVLERRALGVALLEVRRHDVGGATHHAVPLHVGDLAVVGEPVDLVVGGVVADLGDEQLHLVRLLAAAGEDRAEGLGVGVGQARGR